MYDKDFYARCIKKYGVFAQEVIPILINEFNPKSVVDIGCGAGMYIKSFYDKGIDVVGYEGNKNAITYGLLPEKVIIHDVEEELKIDKKFDLCMCVEVAEHVSEKNSDELIKILCRASDVILFTSAKIGQGGTGHINCQNEDYWIEKFQNNHFEFGQKTRNNIRKKIKKLPSFKKATNFFYKNLMIFKKRSSI